ncbi:hypothetical protein HV280_01160 [Escherichia coli]|nr:hypothetical protein [Escherichia coli]
MIHRDDRFIPAGAGNTLNGGEKHGCVAVSGLSPLAREHGGAIRFSSESGGLSPLAREHLRRHCSPRRPVGLSPLAREHNDMQ